MLHHTGRTDRIHVFSADGALLEDVVDRITADPAMEGVEVLAPEVDAVAQAVGRIETMAKDTVRSRLLIVDVRSYLLPRFQHAYNKIVGYNRADLNGSCNTILIGDGPLQLFQTGRSLDVFAPRLASHRVDYHPAVFFYDPFIHYAPDERRRLGLDAAATAPTKIPERLAGAFADGGEEEPTVRTVREYFRAAAVRPARRREAIDRRERKLRSLFCRRIAEAFPHHAGEMETWLEPEGFALTDEVLRLHIYPLHFEHWVRHLMGRRQRARDAS